MIVTILYKVESGDYMAKKTSNRPIESRILLNEYEDAVKEVFDKPANIRKIGRHVSKYIDKNSEALYYMAPTKRVPFNTEGEDGSIILNALGTTSRQMARLIRTINSIKPMAGTVKEPVSVGIALLLREATIREDKQNEDLLMMYLIFSLYWSLQYRQFKYEPNEALTSYTVNNLSNKFLFKTQDNVFEALYVTGETNHVTSEPFLISEDDKDIVTYVMNIRTRVSSLLVRYSKESYKNAEDKKYLNTVQDSREEEDYYEVQNLTGNIEKVANKALTSFFQGSIDTNILRISATYGKISQARLREILIGISSDEPDKVDQIIRGVLIDYVKTSGRAPNTIGGKDFIGESLKILNKSNTKDPNIIMIKDNLSFFLEKYSKTYSATSREATKNGYRKALLSYLTLHISKVVNG